MELTLTLTDKKLTDFSKIVFFDTETVAVNPNFIISLAYRYYEKGKEPKYEIIECNPNYLINPKATEVNGYTDDSVKNFPLFIEQWEKIEPYFRDALLICHNAQFDLRALLLECDRYCLPVPHFYSLDTLYLARQILRKETDIENHKLITLCKYFNIEGENFHSADFDIWATDMVLRKFVECNKNNNEYFNNAFQIREFQGEYSNCPPCKKICDDYDY